VAGAKEGVTFLDEFREAGFVETRLLRTFRNARTSNSKVVAAEVHARR
jgi:hypothetical protein